MYRLIFVALAVLISGCTTQSTSQNRVIVTGTNGNAVILAQLIPVGTIMPYAGGMTEQKRTALAGQGWLVCNGSSASRTQFSELFSVIGTTHGAGEDPQSFSLPDYRGYFLRGVSGDSGRDPDADSRVAGAAGGNTGNRVGSVQGSTVGPHQHKDVGIFETPANNIVIGLVDPKPGMTQTEEALRIGDGSQETRPANNSVHYLIFSGRIIPDPS